MVVKAKLGGQRFNPCRSAKKNNSNNKTNLTKWLEGHIFGTANLELANPSWICPAGPESRTTGSRMDWPLVSLDPGQK